MNKDVMSLINWADPVDKEDLDAILEWLQDSDMLNDKGKLFTKELWKETWYPGKTDEEIDAILGESEQ